MTTQHPGEEAAGRADRRLAVLIRREIASIAAIDAAVARESAPDYVALFHDTKIAKQANVEQLAAVVRSRGGIPEESGGWLKPVLKAQTSILDRVSRRATLRAMRAAEAALVSGYATALETADESLERRALRATLARALVHVHVLTAHIAQESGQVADSQLLPRPLGAYFAGRAARACLRCGLDRPGRLRPLERRDPHPFTYVCAACHDEVVGEFPEDLASQMNRWPEDVREARVIQRATGRPSKLNAIHRVLFPLSGLEPQVPVPAAARSLNVPALTPVPGPAHGETPGDVQIPTLDAAEGDYCRRLFDYRSPREHW